MTTTRDEIARWLANAEASHSHMLVVCDTYDWEDYPVYVATTDDVKAVHARYHGPDMQKVMEVYDLSKPASEQLGERRAMNF